MLFHGSNRSTARKGESELKLRNFLIEYILPQKLRGDVLNVRRVGKFVENGGLVLLMDSKLLLFTAEQNKCGELMVCVRSENCEQTREGSAVGS
jgi:hypothetical protein